MDSDKSAIRFTDAGPTCTGRTEADHTDAGCPAKKRTVELLAPGGSMDSIRAAVNAGADAVYAGGRLFGARAFAENPETEDLLEAIDYCHLHGVKLYLTVNTLLKENELNQILPEYLAPIYECGVDAVLVQDFGVFRFLRENFPDLPIHASTQMTITGADGVRLLEEMGAERIVLSRELSLDEIRSIREQCGAELETFVHGALCYCYSGKCLLSSMIGGRSGNRGRCAQPCRLPWDLYESSADVKAKKPINNPKEKYLLSPKDICTLRLLPDLIEAGIASLKIEGRMKSPEYAAGVTAMYRKYIDLYLAKGREGFRVDGEDEKLLSELFSRGDFSEGYYGNRNGRDMMTLAEKEALKGEALRRTQETVAGIREKYVNVRKKIPLRAKVSIRAGVPAVMNVTRLSTVRMAQGLDFSAEGFVPAPAMNRPADRDVVLKQVGKTGNTDFVYDSIDVDLEEGLFIQVRDLNELRRKALDGIRDEILKPYRRKMNPVTAEVMENRSAGGDSEKDPGSEEKVFDSEKKIESVYEEKRPSDQNETDIRSKKNVQGLYMGGYAHISHPDVTVSVCTQDQLEAVLDAKKVGGVYLDFSICTAWNASQVWNSGRKVYLMLPGIWREDTERIVKERIEREFGSFSPALKASLDGILVGCYDQLYTLKQAELLNDGDGFEVIADAQLYTWNRCAREQLSDLGVTMDTMPYECSAKDLEERGCQGSECVVYGYQTLMMSAQCLTKTASGCEAGKRLTPLDGTGRTDGRVYPSASGIRYLRDRMGVVFPVKNDCSLCMNTIYNSVPLDLVSMSGQVKALSPASVRYLFTVESGKETRMILKGYLPDKMTRGHFRKGVQ